MKTVKREKIFQVRPIVSMVVISGLMAIGAWSSQVSAQESESEEAGSEGTGGQDSGSEGSGGQESGQAFPYLDVNETNVHYRSIEALAESEIFDGTECALYRFCPSQPLPRWAMAVWLVRILDEEDPRAQSSRFSDVTTNLWWEGHVERLAELGVTVGCRTVVLEFCPFLSVSRAQMAVFLSRAFELPNGPDPGFSDVPADAWYAEDVARLASSGITQGCGDGTRFCPSQNTTRAEMASFLDRASG